MAEGAGPDDFMDRLRAPLLETQLLSEQTVALFATYMDDASIFSFEQHEGHAKNLAASLLPQLRPLRMSDLHKFVQIQSKQTVGN